jgi:hypothetical protein
MNGDTLAVALALLAPGGVLAVMIERARRDNNRDHGRNSELLNKIDGKVDLIDSKVDKVDERLFSHIQDHWKEQR